MTAPVIRAVSDPDVVRRQKELFDLYSQWPGEGDPDDDPDFVVAARQIMGLPPLGPSAIRSSAPGEPHHVDGPDAEGAMEDDAEAKARRSRQMALLETRALGHDVTPGHDELHHYWTVGKGKRLWVDSPEPWRTLHALVTAAVRKNGRAVSPEQIDNWVSRWFIEVKGYAAGSDLNRVAHGHPPRGNRVGPG